MRDDATERVERMARDAARRELLEHMDAFHRELRDGFVQVREAIANSDRLFAAAEERHAAVERRVTNVEEGLSRHSELHAKGQRWLVRSVAAAMIAAATGVMVAVLT